MSVSSKDKKIVVVATPEIKSKFIELAEADGRTLSNYVLQILKEYLSQLDNSDNLPIDDGSDK